MQQVPLSSFGLLADFLSNVTRSSDSPARLVVRADIHLLRLAKAPHIGTVDQLSTIGEASGSMHSRRPELDSSAAGSRLDDAGVEFGTSTTVPGAGDVVQVSMCG